MKVVNIVVRRTAFMEVIGQAELCSGGYYKPLLATFLPEVRLMAVVKGLNRFELSLEYRGVYFYLDTSLFNEASDYLAMELDWKFIQDIV